MAATVITIIALFAACLSALYAILTHKQQRDFLHLDLRIRVRDLNRQLHEDKETTKENSETAMLFMERAYTLAAGMKANVEESHNEARNHLARQSERLSHALDNLPTHKRTFADLNDSQLEEQLLELMTFVRVFEDVNGSSKMWQEEYEAIHRRDSGNEGPDK